MSNIICDCNAGMERCFLSKTSSGDTDISKDAVYSIYFDIISPNTVTEVRQLRIVERATSNLIVTIPLNNDGGLKPLNGLTAPYKPTVKPNIKRNINCV